MKTVFMKRFPILIILILANVQVAVIAGASEVKLTASDAAAGDRFGYSVSISGSYAIVGAGWNDDAGDDSGSAYIFVRNGINWTQQQKLIGSDVEAGDRFGYSVSISGDYAIVGADDAYGGSGSAYIFVRSGGTWTEQTKFSRGGAKQQFGFSVSISGDYAIVGSRLEGGDSSGAAYIFKRNGDSWAEQVRLTASDATENGWFGYSVSIDGDYAVVGARNYSGGNRGAVYVFKRNVDTWLQQTKITVDDIDDVDDGFGWKVSIDEDYLIIGAFRDDPNGKTDAGSAYVFKRAGETWIQQTKFIASDAAIEDNFGYSVSICGSYAIVGARYDDNLGGTDAGSVYSFLLSGSSWSQKAKIVATDAAPEDWFGGYSVSIDDDYAIIGAMGVESESGAAYVYHCIEDLSLPVELSFFTAITLVDNVTLKWRTESETNNVGFTIYRSESKYGRFTKVAFVKGAGNTGMPTDYQFKDTKVEPGKTYYYYLEDIDITGERNKSKIIKVVVPFAQPIPKEFHLLQNYPNPFNPETWIPFKLAQDTPVTISIYDTKGQLIRTIALGNRTAGIYTTKDKAVFWDGRDSLGQKVSSGVYYYTLQAGEFRATRKMVILK